jgi:hypothetical protein
LAQFKLAPGRIDLDTPSGQLQFIEFDDQTQADIEQLHGAEQLRFVDGMNFMNGFDLDKQAPLDQQIESSLCCLRSLLFIQYLRFLP